MFSTPRVGSRRTSCGGLLSNLLQKSILITAPSARRRALAIVEETYGSIKGIDRATLISLAEDEGYSGY
jgi:hypothetical protein